MIRNKKMNYIELFAGCGGLSLGLETVGFKRVFANELSPMAAETYAYNLMGANLQAGENVSKIKWLKSIYPRTEMKFRLRENLSVMQRSGGESYCDLDRDEVTPESLAGNLLVGSISDLNHQLRKRGSKLKQMVRVSGDIDLVSGGPPCQSFSMAGLRDLNNHRNQLPWEFAEAVGIIKPKMVLLENVSGILRAFEQDGEKYHAWFEVAKAFAAKNYVPLCLHINAKYVGVAQNRPRFIMLAFRKDIARTLIKDSRFTKLVEALKDSMIFSVAAKKDQSIKYGSLRYYDITRDIDFFSSDLFSDNLFEALMSVKESELVSVKDAIDDLRNTRVRESDYVQELNRQYVCLSGKKLNKYKNHTLRQNGNIVRARFRLYQILKKFEAEERLSVVNRLKKGEEVPVSRKLLKKISRHWLLTVEGEKIEAASASAVLSLIDKLATRKHSQRALDAELPAPAVLASQDDSCHYHESLSSLRSLTIREIARIQSFPDWFEMRSKETTGGLRRRFEVPQYTQVGNAVPPRLGKALGEICREILAAV